MQNFSLETISSGPSGTAETLTVMAQLTVDAQFSPITRTTAVRLLGSSRDGADFAERVRRWVGRHMTLVDEPVEMIARPEWMLDHIGRKRLVGDCDDAAVLFGALVFALGIGVRYVAVAPPEDPSLYIHVFPEVFAREQWLPMDPTTNRLVPSDWPRMVREVSA